MTMLTLLKPWRSGSSLKSDEHSWDESFTQHTFTARQLQLMKNIYECLDACDDYRARLNVGKESFFFVFGEQNVDESEDFAADY